jgi:sigma-B regulation protein RsbU (phosphoserine phosphatase)
MASAPEHREAESAREKSAARPLYRVLLVDDSRTVRTSLLQFFRSIERARFDIHEAENGVEALKVLSANGEPMDLVITDLTMPQMDGLSFIRHVRALAQYRGVPILFLTAMANDEKKIEAFRLGATDYVLKPFLAAELESRIMGYLERKRAFETILEHERALQQSIEQARLTQAALLPQAMPVLSNARLAVRYEPAEHLAGDYYDFYSLDHGRLGILLTDVAGHGLAAALVSFLVAGIIKHNASVIGHPEALLARSHAMIVGKIPEERYATACYATYDPASLVLAYALAGHPAPVLIRPGHEEARQLSAEGSPLGLFKQEDVRFSRGEVQLAPGDRVLFHSDALLDAGEGQQSLTFGRLRRFLLENGALEPEAMLKALYDFGLSTAKHGAYTDDLTMILLAIDAG